MISLIAAIVIVLMIYKVGHTLTLNQIQIYQLIERLIAEVRDARK